MALGKPCISTPISGIPELITNEVDGLLAPQHDSVSLAQALKQILQDSQLQTVLGEAARQKVERQFSNEHNIPLAIEAFANSAQVSANKMYSV